MASDMPATISKEELRSALDTAKAAGDLAATKSILDQPYPDSYLISAGAELYNTAENAIVIAAKDGDVARIHSVFKEWRADVDIPPPKVDIGLERALRDAIEDGKKDVVTALLENGLEARYSVVHFLSDREGRGPNSNTLREMLDDLLAHGWDINGKICGTPIISWARSEPVFLEWLLDHGADPNVISEHGETPLSAVSHSGSLAMVEMLLKHGAVMDDNAIHLALVRTKSDTASFAIINCLLEHGADINSLETRLELRRTSSACRRAPTSTTPLFKAVEVGNIEMVRFLLARGADKEKMNMSHDGPWCNSVDWVSGRIKVDPELRKLLTGSSDAPAQTISSPIPLQTRYATRYAKRVRDAISAEK